MVDVPGRLYFKDEEVYSDWFDRLGDNIIVRGEAIDSNTAAADLKIEVYTKNREDTTKGAKPTSWDLTLDSSSLGTIQETILSSTTSTGLTELVRYRLTVVNASNADDWILARVFPPIFFDAGAA